MRLVLTIAAAVVCLGATGLWILITQRQERHEIFFRFDEGVPDIRRREDEDRVVIT